MEQRESALKQMETDSPKSKAKKQQNDEPIKGRKSDKQLTIHQRYEDIAKGLAEQSQHRLAALTTAVVANREQQVEKFVDILEMADSGELDLHLIVKKLQERREQRMLTEAPQQFNFNVDGFDTRGYGIDLDMEISKVSLTPAWEKPAALLES
jgi:hypothetical protein